ncbi:Crp/Fnr family transcriptional regulator [Altericista sp. CCNU0014]|uniref:Crp/Fnr family transcriptional regulator n=1 Tax=Altericista sp. CCNU0014 TaxID=3082949 RepID=UPI00384FACD3
MFDLTRARTHSSPSCCQVLEDLYRDRNAMGFKKGQFIPMERETILVVYRGLVKLNMLYSSGDESILGLLHPSMPFGLPLSQLTSYEAVALTDVLVMRVDQVQIDRTPRLAQSLYPEMTRRLQQTEALLAITGERRIENRLRALLQFLCQEMGQETPQGMRLNVRLTHQQISEMIGTTRVSVTRMLKDFQKAGWLNVDSKRHLLINGSWDDRLSAA